MNSSSNLLSLRNIGPKVVQYLCEIGIETEEQLRAVGPVDAFMMLGRQHPHLQNRMALYALYGALTDQSCLRLPPETKDWLEEELVRVGYVAGGAPFSN